MDIIDSICDFSARYFNIKESDLYSRIRTSECVLARHMAMYILHVDYNISIGKLSKAFFRDGRTIFYAINKVRYWIQNQKYYKRMYESFMEEYKKSHTL